MTSRVGAHLENHHRLPALGRRSAMTSRVGAYALCLTSLLGACAEGPDASSALSASSASDDSDDAAVRDALGGVEWDPEAPAPVLRGPSAEAALVRLARGRGADPRVVRVRATMALRHHPTEAVRRFLFALAAGEVDPEVVGASLDTLARAFGRSHGAEVRALASQRLSDPDPGVRMAAREAIARIRLARWISDPPARSVAPSNVRPLGPHRR